MSTFKQAAKRQAKLIAVQAAIKDMGPGSYGKNVQDIMKTFNLKGKEGRKQAGAIYNKILSTFGANFSTCRLYFRTSWAPWPEGS